MNKIVLREFSYYDSDLVNSFLASLEGGIFDEERQKTKSTKDGKASLGVNALGLKAQAGGGLSSNQEAIKVVKQVAASQFTRLYGYIEDAKAFKEIEEMDEKSWEQLKNGDLIELRASLELASLSKLSLLLETYNQLAPSLKAMGAETGNQKTLQSLMGMMSTNKNISMVARVAASPNYKFLIKLKLECLLATTDDLQGEFTILGKVQRKIRNDEELPAGDLFQGLNQFVNSEKYHELMQNMPPEFNLGPTTLTAPGGVLTPVAIYL